MLLGSKIWLDASFYHPKTTHWTGTRQGTLFAGLEYPVGYGFFCPLGSIFTKKVSKTHGRCPFKQNTWTRSPSNLSRLLLQQGNWSAKCEPREFIACDIFANPSKMSGREQTSHRAGLLKQQNKSHKTGRHRSKSDIDKNNKGSIT